MYSSKLIEKSQEIQKAREQTKLELRKIKVNDAINCNRFKKRIRNYDGLEIRSENLKLSSKILNAEHSEDSGEYFKFISNLLRSQNLEEIKYGVLCYKTIVNAVDNCPNSDLFHYFDSEVMIEMIRLLDSRKYEKMLVVSQLLNKISMRS